MVARGLSPWGTLGAVPILACPGFWVYNSLVHQERRFILISNCTEELQQAEQQTEVLQGLIKGDRRPTRRLERTAGAAAQPHPR